MDCNGPQWLESHDHNGLQWLHGCNGWNIMTAMDCNGWNLMTAMDCNGYTTAMDCNGYTGPELALEWAVAWRQRAPRLYVSTSPTRPSSMKYCCVPLHFLPFTGRGKANVRDGYLLSILLCRLPAIPMSGTDDAEDSIASFKVSIHQG